LLLKIKIHPIVLPVGIAKYLSGTPILFPTCWNCIKLQRLEKTAEQPTRRNCEQTEIWKAETLKILAGRAKLFEVEEEDENEKDSNGATAWRAGCEGNNHRCGGEGKWGEARRFLTA